jgi:hypothetical protein
MTHSTRQSGRSACTTSCGLNEVGLANLVKRFSLGPAIADRRSPALIRQTLPTPRPWVPRRVVAEVIVAVELEA